MRPKYIYPRKELNNYADKLVKRDHNVELILITGTRKIGTTSIVSYGKWVLSSAGALHLTMSFKYYDLMPPGSPSTGSATLIRRTLAFISYVAERLRDAVPKSKFKLPFVEIEHAKDQQHGDLHKTAVFGVLRNWEGYVKSKALVKRPDIATVVLDHAYWGREEVEKLIEQSARVASDINKQTGVKTVVVLVIRPNVFDALVNSDLEGKYNIPASYGVVGPPSLSDFTNIVTSHGFYGLNEHQAKELYKITGGNPFVAIEYLTYARWGYQERFLQVLDEAFNIHGVIVSAKKQGLLRQLSHIAEDPDAAEDYPEASAMLMREGLLCRANYSSARFFMRPENVKTKYFWASPLIAKYIKDVIGKELGIAN